MARPPGSASHVGPRDRSLSALLDAARADAFIGRAAPMREFVAALRGQSDIRVLFVHGPGGIGKTTLLEAFARQAGSRGHPVRYLDARDVECSVGGLSSALAALPPSEGAEDERVEDRPTDVLLLDGYELLAPLDRWIREQLLPARPAGSLTVLAGREPPSAGWRLDPGWQRLTRVHELDRLDDDESDQLLAGLGVAGPRRSPLARIGRGYPLVLAMLAEPTSGVHAEADLARTPHLVSRLCELILDDVPAEAHRTGLATCAHATRMTQDLLRRTVGPRADEVWAWLESRPYVRRGEFGLFLHDVVRELFEAEFAQRAPESYAALHRTVRAYFLERLSDPLEPHPDRAAAEILLIHRRSPLPFQVDAMRSRGIPPVQQARADEHAAIVDLVRERQGSVAAATAAWWIERQPEGLYRVRLDGEVLAFALHVYVTAADDVPDPVVRAGLDAVARTCPLREGERVEVARFAAVRGGDESDPLQLLVNGVSSILEWVRRPAAWTLLIATDPVVWTPYFEYLGLRELVTVPHGGLPWTVYGWDRRRFGVDAFFELMARRELTGETGPPPPDLLRPPPVSKAAFEEAVVAALRVLTRPDRLTGSPLLRTALVDPAAPDPVAALSSRLRDALHHLGEERRGAEHRRVLESTYLARVPSQEAAAELLRLPFSTYRRHLAKATERLVEVLWAVEIERADRDRSGLGVSTG
jgi:hypothetical protein